MGSQSIWYFAHRTFDIFSLDRPRRLLAITTVNSYHKHNMKFTIVGGGFGGVKTALELAKHHHNQITVITDKPDFQYYPALYGTATGRSHLQSWVPLGQIFAGKLNIHVVIDKIDKVDPATKTPNSAGITCRRSIPWFRTPAI